MHIAIDLDDCVLDFVGGLRAVLKKEYAVELADDEIFQFDLHPILDPIVGQSWWTWLRQRHWLWGTFPAVDGAIGALEQLRRDGHYLVCVTSKPRWAEYTTMQWLGKWRPPFQQVIIVDKDDVKADLTDAEVLVDDKLDNLIPMAKSGRGALLFTRPHNKNQRLPLGVIRVDSWADVLEQIKMIEAPEA